MLNTPLSSMRRQLLLTFVMLWLAAVAGCVPKVANKLPAAYVNRDLAITGEFHEEFGAQEKLSIKKTDDEELSYSAATPGMDTDKFQVYTIGKLNLAFMPNYDEDDNNRTEILGYSVARLQVTKTQIVVEPLTNKFFEDNPAALPSTTLPKPGSATDITLNSTPEQLALFFKLHQDTAGLFDVKHRIVYNRIK